MRAKREAIQKENLCTTHTGYRGFGKILNKLFPRKKPQFSFRSEDVLPPEIPTALGNRTGGLLIGVNGSISNRVTTSIIRNGTPPLPGNARFLSFDSWTEQQRELIDTGAELVHSVTVSEYGMAGDGMRIQRCMKSLKTGVESAIAEAKERAMKNGYSLKFYSTLLLPTGSCSVGSVITSCLAKEKFGLHTLVHSVIPDILSAENYQLINAIYVNAVASFQPLVILPENFAPIPEDVVERAGLASGGKPSNFYILSEFFSEFNFKLSRLIGGLNESLPLEAEDDPLFMDAENSRVRNQSCELEAAIAGRQELFTIHHSFCTSGKCNWGEMATVSPLIKPVEPGDVIALVEYDPSTCSEDQIQSQLKSSFDNQELQIERILYLPSCTNALTVWIPTEVPHVFRQMIDHVKGNRSLRRVLESWARHGIISSLPPVLRGRETAILRERLNQIFLHDKSELEELARSRFALPYEELVKRNLLFWLAENEGVYLRPVGV
ncbi:MAG: hypothetical protein ACXQTD_08275 [Candidatus Syntropharchaeia archaeon]